MVPQRENAHTVLVFAGAPSNLIIAVESAVEEQY